MSLFVTGTDTEIGKTVVSALVARRHRAGYWKPIASGAATDPRDVAVVGRLAGVPTCDEVHLFPDPVSPHQAARRAGVCLRLGPIVDAFADHRRRLPRLVVEGVGGLLVPLDDDGLTVADLASALGLPCLVVARTGLGTLNHTLLTLAELERRGLEVAAVVPCAGPPAPVDPSAPAHRSPAAEGGATDRGGAAGPATTDRGIAADNLETLRRLAGVPVLDPVPSLSPLDPATVAAAAAGFDPDGVLAPVFGEP